MEQNKNTARVWYTVSAEKIIAQLRMPRIAEAYLPELCRYDPQKITDAVLELAGIDIRMSTADVLPLAAINPSLIANRGIDCIVVLGGEQEELKKIIGYDKPFEWMENPLEHEDPVPYGKIREDAYNLLRKQNVKNLSEDELWRAFSDYANARLYMAIIRKEISDGLTIKKFYADRERGLER